MINKQSNEITELKNQIKSLTSELSTLKTLVLQVTVLENKFSSKSDGQEPESNGFLKIILHHMLWHLVNNLQIS